MRILVVDDDYVSRVKLMAILNPYGQCDSAPDGDIALKLCEAAHKELVPYDLITMDIEMPGMNGQAVVDQVRKIEEALKIDGSQAVKILMVTVKAALKDVSTAYYRGCNGYLKKPTTPEDIKHALEDIGLGLGA
ncbi:MAG: response regulator [Candidatus Omnitrophota bacterium]